jgi:hypothetical protein
MKTKLLKKWIVKIAAVLIVLIMILAAFVAILYN